MIKYKCIFVFIFSSFVHIKSACDLFRNTPTCSLLFLDSFNRNNVICYKQIQLKLLHVFVLFTGFKLYYRFCRFNRLCMRKCKWLIFTGDSVVQLLRKIFYTYFYNFILIINSLHLYCCQYIGCVLTHIPIYMFSYLLHIF